MQEEHTGRFYCDGQFAHKGERDSCHATGFYFTREQSHGPCAYGSGGHQQDKIDVCLSQLSADLVAWEQQIVRIIDKTEAVVRFGDVAYDSLGLQLKQALQWEDQIEIARGISPVVMFVSDAQVATCDRAWDGAKGCI